MRFAICPLSVIPIRSQANHQSELLSQLLFGEMAEVIDKKGKQWLKVRGLADNQFGWVQSNQLTEIDEKLSRKLETDFAFALDISKTIRGNQNHFTIPIGARLPQFDGLRFKLLGKNYEYSGQAVSPDEIKRNAQELLPKIARKFLNIPEMKGGRTAFGMDSSALIQHVFGFIGINLPRTADLQIDSGENIDFSEQSGEGDLAFFENRKGKITHVGLILNGGQIIHSFGKVRIDKIDHYGIFDEETNKYSHKLRLIKRNLAPKPTSEKTEIQENEISLIEQKILFEN